jgi:hypothetical protein
LIITSLPAAFAATATTAIAITTTWATGATALSATAATRTTETAAATTRTATRASFFAGASFVNLQGAAFQLFAIQAIDSGITFTLIWHLNEAKTA